MITAKSIVFATILQQNIARSLVLFSHRTFSFRGNAYVPMTFRGQTLPNACVSRPPQMTAEGPEIRILVDQLQPAVGMRLINFQFLSSTYRLPHDKAIGFDAFCETMSDVSNANDEKNTNNVDVITEWNAKGTFIYVTLNGGADNPTGCDEDDKHDDYLRSIWITLGMNGRFVSENFERNEESIQPYLRWFLEIMDLKSGKIRKIFYRDAHDNGTLRFSLSRKELMTKLDSLGLDILDKATTAEEDFVSIAKSQNSELNVCTFLMNQSKICGIGDYILAEGLFRAQIDPFASLKEISICQLRSLYTELRATSEESYREQDIAWRAGSYRDVEGKKGRLELSLQCYGRDYCPQGRPVCREVDGPHGRTIWYVEDQLFVPRSKRKADGTLRSLDDFGNKSSSEDNSPPDELTNNGYSFIEEGNTDDVVQLACSLTDQSWKGALKSFILSDKFYRLARFISSERLHGTIYPPETDVFSALNLCPLDNVKVVIIGQDPYHGPKQGHGLAFSVRKGVKLPPSLCNIFKELVVDQGIIGYPSHGNLESWAKQGVLLLNTVLTVRQGEANSHSNMGWEDFTDEIINILNEKKSGLVFLLWGGSASKKASGVDQTKHFVIRTSHPSPLGATKTNSPFLGSKCFSRCNEALLAQYKEPIDWGVY